MNNEIQKPVWELKLHSLFTHHEVSHHRWKDTYHYSNDMDTYKHQEHMPMPLLHGIRHLHKGHIWLGLRFKTNFRFWRWQRNGETQKMLQTTRTNTNIITNKTMKLLIILYKKYFHNWTMQNKLPPSFRYLLSLMLLLVFMLLLYCFRWCYCYCFHSDNSNYDNLYRTYVIIINLFYFLARAISLICSKY